MSTETPDLTPSASPAESKEDGQTPLPRKPLHAKAATAQNKRHDAFIRAAGEDDDGYDPYSDRPADPEPTFEEDPWR